MNQELLQSATTLADTLAAENRALSDLDFTSAANLFGAKLRATDAFVAAHARAAAAPGEPRDRRRLVGDVVTRLRELTAENKRLLERAVLVQGRVIGAVVRAVPKVTRGVPRYGSGGALTETSRVWPMALSARA